MSTNNDKQNTMVEWVQQTSKELSKKFTDNPNSVTCPHCGEKMDAAYLKGHIRVVHSGKKGD